MATTGGAADIQVNDGEKLTPVMIYTQNLLAWGQAVTVQAIRVSSWLRTQSKPTYIKLLQAQILDVTAGEPPKPQYYKEIHLPTAQVIAFHIKPPDHDPIDYDPNEANRIMVPVTIKVGTFRFSGKLRMSAQTNLGRYLDVSKVDFMAIYEVSITQPTMPALGVIRVPYALLRSEGVIFAPV